jgi:hypothetical protein
MPEEVYLLVAVYPVRLDQQEYYINPILHTWFRDSCFTCDGSPTIKVFPLIFYIGMVI